MPEAVQSTSSKKNLYIAIAAVIFVCLAGLAYYSKNINNQLSNKPPDVLLASVGDHKIYLNEVKKETFNDYGRDATDKKSLQQGLDTLIEHSILDNQALKLNLSVSDTEVQQKIAESASPSAIMKTDSYKTTLRYRILKDKIISQILKTRTAYTIDFWIPPLNYPDPLTPAEKTKYDTMRQIGKTALAEVQQRI